MSVSKPVGPVDVAVLAFPGDAESSAIFTSIAEVVESGTVRVLDVAIVRHVSADEVILRDLDSGDDVGFAIDFPGLVSEEEALEIGAQIALGEAAAVIVWENVWAARVGAAIREAGGQLLTLERLPREDAAAMVQLIDHDANAHSEHNDDNDEEVQ
ncbi:MAG: DUF6325 family protein [Ornithinimicrobium sp.]